MLFVFLYPVNCKSLYFDYRSLLIPVVGDYCRFIEDLCEWVGTFDKCNISYDANTKIVILVYLISAYKRWVAQGTLPPFGNKPHLVNPNSVLRVARNLEKGRILREFSEPGKLKEF